MSEDKKEPTDFYKYTTHNDENLWNSKIKTKSSFASRISKNKKLLGGGIAGTLALLIFFGFGAISTYTLETIQKDLVGYEAKTERKVEQEATKTLLSKVLCFKYGIKCRSNAPTNDGSDLTEAETTAAEGGGLSSEISNDFSFTNPEIQQSLESNGFQVTVDSSGNFKSLIAPDGSVVTPDDILNNTNGIFDNISAALPEWAVGQLEGFRSLMFKFANASFNVLPDNTTESSTDAAKAIESADTEGASGSIASQEAVAAVSESETNPKSSQLTASEASTAAQETAASTEAVNALTSADQSIATDISHGASLDSAQNLAESSLLNSLGGKLTDVAPGQALAFAQDACLFDELVNNQVVKHLPLIMSLLIRNGTTTISLASQLVSGKITGQDYSAAMKMFVGSSNPIDAGTNAALPFSASAGWQQATGGSGGIPIAKTSLPTIDGVMSVMNTFNSIINKLPGGRGFCSVSNNIFGGIAIGIGGLFATGGIDFASLGTSEIVFAGLQAGTLATIYTVVPKIVEMITPFNLMGYQNAVQNMNNTDAGLNLAYNNYSRSMGGMPQTPSQSQTNYNSAIQSGIAFNNSKPWIYRTFALNNPDSLVAKLALDIPLSASSLVSNIINYLATIPSELMHGIADLIIFPKILAASQSTNYPGKAYSLTQYSMSSNTVNKYDPIANENYLFSKVTYNGNSARRIDMLGNPNTINAITGDNNNNDLLHCFIDSYSQIYASATNGGTTSFQPSTAPYLDSGADKNCGALGLYNLNDYSDNGNNGPIQGLPNEQTIAAIYCKHLDSIQSENDPKCINTLLNDGQVNNDLGHFREYLLDLNVMNNLISLGTSK